MTWSGVMPPSRKAMLKAVTTGDSSRHAITQIEDSVSESKGGLGHQPGIPGPDLRRRARAGRSVPVHDPPPAPAASRSAGVGRPPPTVLAAGRSGARLGVPI